MNNSSWFNVFDKLILFLFSFFCIGKSKLPLTGLRKNELDTKNLINSISTEHKILKAVNLKGRNQVIRHKEIKLSDSAIKLIFQNFDTIKKYDCELIYREFAEFLKGLKIAGSIVNLRHTYATNNFYLGTPELIISRQMGHSTSQITKDIYTDIDYHLTREKVLELYGKLYPEF